MGASINNFFVSQVNARLKLSLSIALMFAAVLFQTGVFAEEKDANPGATAMQEGVVAFESKMYGYSKTAFEKALEYDRSNYDAMLYLAKVNYHLEDYSVALKHAASLTSSFYPPKQLKIDAFILMGEVENKKNNPWLALSYINAARELSTNVDISNLVDDQMARLEFDSLSYPDFSSDADGVMTSSTLGFENGIFIDQESKRDFEPVSFSVSSLNSKFVILAGFDDRNRFTKLLLLRSKSGLKPKLEQLEIQGKKRGGILGANDMFLKVMDWNFDSYPDLAVRVSPNKSENKQAFLIFNPKNEKFEINEALSELNNPILDRKTNAVIEESCKKGKEGFCSRKRYKLFDGEYALAQFEKNQCVETTCVYTNAEIEVSSLKTSEHMYLVNTIETESENLKSRFSSGSAGGAHTIITRRVLRAYYTPNYDVPKTEQAIMTLDLDGSWEFPASYVRNWVNNYFSRQPLNGQLTEVVSETQLGVIN